MKTIKVTTSSQIPKDFTGIVEYDDGTKEWHKEGKRHRLDGPAVEWADGDRFWFIEGLNHRIDGPAVEYSCGRKEWWINGNLHREDGPAIEWENGSKQWYVDGILCFEVIDITDKLFIGKEKGKHGLVWLKFLDEGGIKEYPIIPGMNFKIVSSLNSYIELVSLKSKIE